MHIILLNDHVLQPIIPFVITFARAQGADKYIYILLHSQTTERLIGLMVVYGTN